MNRETKAASRGPAAQYVTFRLSEETFAINVMKVQEVLRVSEIAVVPGAPGYVLGIINLRGNVVTVIDARLRMGMEPQEPDDASRVIVIEGDRQVVGVLVDSVAEVIELAEADIEPAPDVGGDEASRYIQGVFSSEGKLTIVVDLNRLLSDEEWSEVAAV